MTNLTKTIKIDPFDIASIDKAIEDLESYKETVKKKSVKICERLAEIGMKVVEINYASGYIDGNDDVNVTTSPIPNGYMLVASGKDVYFLEFGAGVAAGKGYDTSVIKPPVDISPGSWSSTEGTGEFAKYGSWHYKKKKYTMTTPKMGMYHATKEMERSIKRVVEEVFND